MVLRPCLLSRGWVASTEPVWGPDPPAPPPRPAHLRVSFDVSLLKRLEVARLRLCGRGEASWESVGEVGGPFCTPVPRRSRTCPPWKVLRMLVPRERRVRSEELDEVAMLWLEGEAGGTRLVTEL